MLEFLRWQEIQYSIIFSKNGAEIFNKFLFKLILLACVRDESGAYSLFKTLSQKLFNYFETMNMFWQVITLLG